MLDKTDVFAIAPLTKAANQFCHFLYIKKHVFTRNFFQIYDFSKLSLQISTHFNKKNDSLKGNTSLQWHPKIFLNISDENCKF